MGLHSRFPRRQARHADPFHAGTWHAVDETYPCHNTGMRVVDNAQRTRSRSTKPTHARPGLRAPTRAGTGLAAATPAPELGWPLPTSAPGPGALLPQLHRDWSRLCHICTGSGLATGVAVHTAVTRGVLCCATVRVQMPRMVRSLTGAGWAHTAGFLRLGTVPCHARLLQRWDLVLCVRPGPAGSRPLRTVDLTDERGLIYDRQPPTANRR